MTDGLFIVAFSAPGPIENEAERIAGLLDNGVADMVHIRKPTWPADITARLIGNIPARLHPMLKIHDHFQLLERFNLAGVHLNSRNPVAPAMARSVSASFHDVEQLELSKHYDYVTLSPIFDSISKQGYRSAFSLRELMPAIRDKKVVALGGVTPDKFPSLREAGFFGAAMLGHFWK